MRHGIVVGYGRKESNDVIGVMYVAIKYREHKDKVDLNYAYKNLINDEVKRLHYCGVRGIDDIRPKWTTYE